MSSVFQHSAPENAELSCVAAAPGIRGAFYTLADIRRTTAKVHQRAR
jgi:hypothetical protein